jgi:UDP-3-O-[3-hydroxymyristoyl] glucosamine N-acyltransferase
MATKKYSIAELAEMTGAYIIGNPAHLIEGVDSLENAKSEDASFLANARYREQMKSSQAGVICIDPSTELPAGKNFLVHESPSQVFQIIVEALLKDKQIESGFSGIHPTAVIHPQAMLGPDVVVGPYVVIDRYAKIGARTRLFAHASIGPSVDIGEDCILYPHAVVREGCQLGSRVILQPGAVVGSCGFGYTTSNVGHHTKLEQLGIVVLEDDVEIGANTTIDRARFKETRIGRGSKIDNLVQLGHNVTLGEYNLIVSQTGIAGSTKTGRNVVMGGQAGVVGHLEIADYVMIATRGGVSKNIPQPGKYGGEPVMPLAAFNRQQVHARKIGDYLKRIEALEQKLQELETREASLKLS